MINNKTAKKIIKWLVITHFLRLPRTIIRRCVIYVISLKRGYIIFYNEPEKVKVIDLIRKIKDENAMMLCDNEAYQIFMAVKATQKIDGDIAEVGSYKGGSSKLICEAKKNKTLYLFDTFEGLPDLSSNDDLNGFHKGDFVASLNGVKKYLSKYEKVHIFKGIFPSTSDPIKDKTFSFIHLDVDLYEATLESLKFFYPRMNKGGIIISHDYENPGASGVKKAFQEFFKDKDEPIIEMSGYQCLIVKTSDVKIRKGK